MSSTTDEIEISKIDQLSFEDYIAALHQLEDEITEHHRKMLRIHYESPNYEITATRLAQKLEYEYYSAANLHYGRFAKKFCQIFQVTPNEHLSSLVKFEKINGEWHWYLRPQLIVALEHLNWFGNETISIIKDVDEFRNSTSLEKTTAETIIQSRLGQGQFRSSLVRYWQGCSITNCKLIRVLKASHIKPWRVATNEERLDLFNGLLLLPNLDTAFDQGLISFNNDGIILISSKLGDSDLVHLGINREMRLRKIDIQHHKYLEFHRNQVFKK